VFMTTNHFSKLDKALIRPGRVDVIKYFGLASEQQSFKLFKRFFPEQSDEMAKQFSAQIAPNTRSMAEIQGFLLSHSSNPSSAIKEIQFLSKSNEEGSSSRSDSGRNSPSKLVVNIQ
jgi:chaperone BCS1